MTKPAPPDGGNVARTRIIATLGPASSSVATIRALIAAGATGFRVNFSHGTHDDHAAVIARVRKVARNSGRPIAIIADLQGPKIRTGALRGGHAVNLVVGESVSITHKVAESSPGVIATTYRKLAKDVKVGDRILLDDGSLELHCTDKTEDALQCVVIGGGLLRANKGINLPGVKVSTPSLTTKDRRDLVFALEHGVDYVALSFVRSADDVKRLRRLIDKSHASAAIISKIEKPEAVEDLDAILDVSEGIMVARGDLGVEIAGEQLPVMQKEIIARARQRGRVVITATQMLESMIENLRPTRAETSDVANAILDGTDGVMLSGETAVGRHPIAAVSAMLAIALHTENSLLYRRIVDGMPLDPGGDAADATVHAACTAADELGARAVVAFSSSGRTCFKASFARPRCALVAATFSEATYRRLALCWGVHALLINTQVKSVEDLYFLAERSLLAAGITSPGDWTVLVTGSNIGAGGTNSMKIHRVGTVDVVDDKRVRARFRRLFQSRGI